MVPKYYMGRIQALQAGLEGYLELSAICTAFRRSQKLDWKDTGTTGWTGRIPGTVRDLCSRSMVSEAAWHLYSECRQHSTLQTAIEKIGFQHKRVALQPACSQALGSLRT